MACEDEEVHLDGDRVPAASRAVLRVENSFLALDQSLLRYIGCNAETRLLATVFGDELALRNEIIHTDPTTPAYFQFLTRFIRQANAGASPLQMLGRSWAASHR